MRLHPLLILATFIASFVQLHTADAQCECGYQDELGRIWQEALVLSSFANYTFNSTSDLRITENQLPNDSGINGVAAPYQIQNTKDNVMIQGRDLAIRVQSAVQKPYILGGEVTTMRNDILYGSFRSTLKTTSVLGTCAGFFHYGNRTNEVDIEILSVQAADRKVNFVQHEMILLPDNTPSPLSIQTPDVGVNPSADYNEYRFDWTPTSSDFFVNGNYILSLTANEPSKEGIVIWNHWSKGLQGWDQGPPLNDSYLLVRSFKLFFNTSDATGFNRRCNAARNSTNTTATARSVCSVAGITGDITSANSASGVENKKAQQNASDNSVQISHIALITVGVACGAGLLIGVASLPIRYIKSIKKEARLTEQRRDRTGGEDPPNGFGDDASSGSDHTERDMSGVRRRKYQQPPNFLMPPVKVTVFHDGASGTSSDADGTYVGAPSWNFQNRNSFDGTSSDDEAWGSHRPVNQPRPPVLPSVSDIQAGQYEPGVTAPLVSQRHSSDEGDHSSPALPRSATQRGAVGYQAPPENLTILPRQAPPRVSSAGRRSPLSTAPQRDISRMRESSGYESSTTIGTSDAETDDDAAGLMRPQTMRGGR